MPMFEEECNKCGKVIEFYAHPGAPEVQNQCDCGGVYQRIYSVPRIHIFQEYTSGNIRKDGQPVTVTSAAHERQLCKENGVQKMDSGVGGMPNQTVDTGRIYSK